MRLQPRRRFFAAPPIFSSHAFSACYSAADAEVIAARSRWIGVASKAVGAKQARCYEGADLLRQ